MSQKVRQRVRGDYTLLDGQIGFRVHLKRVLAQMSEEQLAAILRIDLGAVSDYEQGKKPFSAAMLYHVSLVLRIPISNFFESFSDLFDLDANPGVICDGTTTFPYEGLDKTSKAEQSVAQLLEAFNLVKEPSVRQRMVDLMKMLANAEEAVKDHQM